MSSMIDSALSSSIRFGVDSRRSIPSSTSASVFSDIPRRPRNRPASAAVRRSSIDSILRSMWSCRTDLGPSPGIWSSATSPGGISARSRS